MTNDQKNRLSDLFDRIARLRAAESWQDDLNPSQRAALEFLGRANRFSRSPSQVADYLASTRGTVSQTLKSLLRKGLVEEVRSETDKRSISYEVTPRGLALLSANRKASTMADLADGEAKVLTNLLERFLHAMLAQRGGRSFGICSTCKYHSHRKGGGYCRLLEIDLLPAETGQICHEHERVSA
jgi:DNA-binding MarR family transcriptional regulator